MPVTEFAADDLFIFRITKSLATNPDRQWQNTYEFRAVTSGDTGALIALGTALVLFEQSMHMSQVVFERLLISTWVPDSHPYDPAAFIASSLTAVGARGGLADLQPLSQCLTVTRQANSGRFGHIFYRGFLLEDDSNAPAGKPRLVARSDIQDDMEAALTSSGLGDYITVGGHTSLMMCMVNKDGSNVRDVNALRVQGVSQLPLDHKWFNRSPGGGGGV